MIDLYVFDKGISKITTDEIDKHKDKLIWIDIIDITKGEADLIRDSFELHPLTTEDFVKAKVRVKIEEFPNYTFFVFYGSNDVNVVEIDFVLNSRFIITNHKAPMDSFEDLKANLQKLESLFKKGTEFIFHKLLGDEIDDYEPVLEEIEDRIELCEEQLVTKPGKQLLINILKIKQDLVQIHKYVAPQQEKIRRLVKEEIPFLTKKSAPYFRDLNDHMIRIADTVNNQRETISAVFDAYTSFVSLKSNDVMKTLSIIATIMLPLTVISSIYGTNFSILPGATSPYGFWSMIAVMILLTAGLLYSFRKREWF